jgi:hypothetical protein
MKGKKKKSISVKRLHLGKAIVAAIQRSELVCNPAIVSRPLFSIHVRKLAAGLTHSWIVSLSVNVALQQGKARKLIASDFR